jgi:hypothetical protein
MKTLVKLLMMQASSWVVAMAAILILSGNAAYAEESEPSGKPADGYIFTLNQKSAETLYEMKEHRLKAIEARKAEQEAKARKQEKKAKVDRLQGKTGRSATSWQVLNR